VSWRVPLTEIELAESDVEATMGVLESGWLTMGPRTQQLERAFAQSVGAEHAVAVSSCTAALHLACLAAGVGQGDEVIVPAMTFVATAHGPRRCGAEVVLGESVSVTDPNLDPADVVERITPHTKAVIAVHLCGYPADVDGLRSVCADRDLFLIEDCAQAAGGRMADGRALGSVGDLGCFSFSSKTLLGVGEGGIVVTDDADLAARVGSLRSHAMTSVTWDRHRGHAETYDVTDLGFNYRIDEVRAALAHARLTRLEPELARRRDVVRAYRQRLAALEGLELPYDDGAVDRSGHFAFPVLLGDRSVRDRVRAYMHDRGIQTSFYPSLTQFTAYAPSDVAGTRPRAEEFADRHCVLPLFPLTETRVEAVVAELSDALG